MKALCLVRLSGRQPHKTVQEIKANKGVEEVFLTFGRFDAAVFMTAPDIDGIKDFVKAIHSKTGVKRTETLIEV